QPFARVDDERCRKAAEKDPLPVDAAHPWDTLSAVTDLLERKVGSLTVRIDRTTCIGTANCAKVAPELFVLDDERIVTFREPAVASRELFVAERQGQIVGFGQLDPRRGEIEACYVAPGAVGFGIGKALLGRMEEEARRRGHSVVHLNATLNAESFYERMGYRR